MRILLDTNRILGYLLADIPEQVEAVAKAVRDGACTAPELFAECVYVLLTQRVTVFLVETRRRAARRA